MWFTENPWPPVMVLVVLGLVFGIAWYSTKRGIHFLLAIGMIALCLVVFVAEEMIITEGERVEQRVVELLDTVKVGDIPKVVAFLSDDAKTMKIIIENQLERVDVHDDIRLTDLFVELSEDEQQATSHFRANGTVTFDEQIEYTSPTRWRLTWKRENDIWRIIKIERLDPIQGEVINTFSG